MGGSPRVWLLHIYDSVPPLGRANEIALRCSHIAVHALRLRGIWLPRILACRDLAMRSTVQRLVALSALVTVAACSKREPFKGVSPQPLRVAAAADLTFAFRDVGDAFEKQTARKVDFSFGSTGMLAKQISKGSQFDVFAAANVTLIDEVVKAGACFADTKTPYAIGRVVLWGKKGTGVPATINAVADTRFGRIAIADPEHAPYGLAAKQALTKAGLWAAVENRIVRADNVQHALEFAQTGRADIAIVALSLAVASEGEYTLVDSFLHDPLEQALVVCKTDGDTLASARAFAAFVASEPGRTIMRRYGFFLPGEPVELDRPR
jgi:molybdate transport system substrate-binding protein